ncbi:YdcF family protein [Bacillus sp. T33-2]|uniref:YdcF family protein n=1 Tax=Bacillus sp. T33-2 TaxID=2054168 RepID=UPI000C759AB8|nr:YdcF family protein [Bacillus sp. T33-2]PLR98427.1 cytoplasmic protein [Bacillus sp. T33-2]
MKTRMLTKPIHILAAVGLVYVGFLHFKIYQHSHMKVPKNVDYVIVLGARVKGTVPSLALQSRIDKAADFLKDHENCIAIASGGKGSGEDIPEAESIKRELVKQGIDGSRILLEDKSTDTYENIRFSKALIPETAKTGLVVTNDFHIFRAKMIANDEGLEISGLPAETPYQAVLKSYIREYLALTKYYIKTVL